MIRGGTIKLPFTFAAGKAGSAALAAIKEREAILGSYCGSCNVVLVPARSFCPHCNEEELEPRDVGPKGTLQYWTEVPGRGIFGYIALEGADSGFVHHLLASPAGLACGAQVIAAFGPVASDPAKTELKGFELVGSSS